MKVYVIVIRSEFGGDQIHKIVDSSAKAVEFCTYHDPIGHGTDACYTYYEMEVE